MTTRRIEKSANPNLLPVLAALLRAVPGHRRRLDGTDAQLRSGCRARRATFAGGAAHALRGAKRVARRVERFRCARQERGAAQGFARRGMPGTGDAATWSKLNDGVATVAEARPAVETIQASNQEVRELAPKLLSELGDLGSSVGVQKLEGMSRYLERFELTVQRIQQDLNGLSSGVSDAGPSAQRLADSLEFLNQVIRGLSGEESGIAIQKVTGRTPNSA